jgi:hypothetical protein
MVTSLIEKLGIQNTDDGRKLIVMYDIACMLRNHLAVNIFFQQLLHASVCLACFDFKNLFSILIYRYLEGGSITNCNVYLE